MSHSQFFEICKAGGMYAVIVQRRVFTGKRLVFPPIFFRETAGCIPGKFFYMEFIYDPLCALLRRPVILPAFRVSTAQVHSHTPRPVHPAGFCIRVGGLYFLSFHLQRIIIINAVHILLRMPAPHAFFFLLHGNAGHGLPAVSRRIQIQGDPLCRRTPQFKRNTGVRAGRPEIFSAIDIIVFKFPF